MPQFECIATLLRSLGSYQPNFPLPYLFNIGDKLFTSIPYHAFMKDNTTNTLVDFEECEDNTNYRIHNWARILMRKCPEEAKHTINSIVKDGHKISFIFNDSFEIFSNNTISIFGELYDVIGNTIKDSNIPAFIGFNTTEDCIINANFEANLRNFTSYALGPTVHAAGFMMSDREESNMPFGDSSIASTFLSFTKDGIITICGIIFAILAILKIQEYCKNSKNIDQSNSNYLQMKKITEKEMEYQGKTYKYDLDQDIWTPCLGIDDATYHA